MSKKHRRRIFKNPPISKVAPNIATLSALFVGVTQIRFALIGKWSLAIVAVVFAALLDATDGRLARFFNSCSRFGAELDSLSDFAVFGLSPAVVMYLYGLYELDRLGWLAASFFAMCMCLRLARFNTQDIENVKTPLSGKFFVGVPAPAGAILALFPIVLYNAFELELFRDPYFCLADVAVAGILCISRIPTPSIKKFHIKREQYTMFLLCVSIMIGAIFAYTWIAFSFMIFAYLISIFFCIKLARNITKNENINDKAPTDK